MKFSLTILLGIATSAVFAQSSPPFTLTDALSAAYRNRASIAASQHLVDQAQFNLRSVSSHPTTSLALGYGTDPRTGGSDNDLVLSQPIDSFGRVSRSRSLGQARVMRAQAGLVQTQQEVQEAVLSAYLEAATALHRVELAVQSEELTRRVLEAVRGLVNGGKLPGTQAVRVGIELDRITVNRAMKQSQALAAIRRLEGVIGQGQVGSISTLPTFDFNQVEASGLKARRADLLLLTASIKEAEAEAKVAQTNRSPQLELQVRRTPWQESSSAYGARIQLSFPLFDHGKASAEVTASVKATEAAKAALKDRESLAIAELDAARIEMSGSKTRVENIQKIVATSLQLVERTQVGLKEGASTLLDVLDALRALREIEESALDARVELAQSEAKLLKVSGSLLGGSR